MTRVRTFLSVFLVFFVFIPPAGGDVLPQTIGSLVLEKSQSGDEARQEIDRLHGKPISFQRGYIGTYGGGDGKAKLWISEYESEGKAVEAIAKMTRGVKGSKEGAFWHFREISIDGIPVYFVVGMGQAHYFFQKGAKAVWLEVDPSIAQVAIRDLIKKIP
jgi:hypothetical protein